MRRSWSFLLLVLFIAETQAAVIEGAASTQGPSKHALPALEAVLARTTPSIRSVRLELGGSKTESFSIRKAGDTGADHTGLG